MVVVVLAALALCTAPRVGRATADEPGAQMLWRETVLESSAIPSYVVRPLAYRAIEVDLAGFAAVLAAAPPEGSAFADETTVVVALPLPDGGSARVRVESYAMMEPGLARRFPEIGTFIGQGMDDPALTARLDLTPAGLHAQVFTPRGAVYLDPWQSAEGGLHVVYWRQDRAVPSNAGDGVCRSAGRRRVVESGLTSGSGEAIPGSNGVLTGETLRIYRLAVAATGEYTQFHGGTVPDGLAAIVTTVNRVNGIFERDVAIRMMLVGDNDQIVYPDPAADPYTASGAVLLDQNQANLDAEIGVGNYDLGHLFSAVDGGLAENGVACGAAKAKGLSGRASPVNDAFSVGVVAHRLGHQFGAHHTFNGDEGACAGERDAATAYEPGSGSTIMGFAGKCGSQNLQAASDDYFHAASLIEIGSYASSGQGASCATTSATGNQAPEVTFAAPKMLPVSTPFRLGTVSTDPDGDLLTFTWEQYDLGPAEAPGSPTGDAPIIRSLPPGGEEWRTIPRLSDLLANTADLGETLPTYARTLHFRLTARDNRPGGGGVTSELFSVPVTALAGPFRVTIPNTAVTWKAFENELVTWDVAGTAGPPVSCANVDIRLFVDGDVENKVTVASSTLNDGSEMIEVPNLPSTRARIRIFCSDDEWFDISDVDFTVLEDFPPLVTITAPAADAVFTDTDMIAFAATAVDDVDGDLTAGLSWSSNVDWSFSGVGGSPASMLRAGYHTITAEVADGNGQEGTDTVHLVVEDPATCPADVPVTSDPAVGVTTTYRAAGTVTLGPTVTVAVGADLRLFAGSTVEIANDVVIAGLLWVRTTPYVCY